MQLIIVTGLSGAGKSRAMQCMEDLGYFCVDNIPPTMLSELLKNAQQNLIEKIAVALDIRGRQFFTDLDNVLVLLKDAGVDYKVIFLEASKQSLLRRYQETRRIHPLAKDGDTEKAIENEIKIMEPVRKQATFVIDTSELKTSGLNSEIARLLGEDSMGNFSVTIQSFGFKHGLPSEADWILDVRFVPNPFYVPSLKNLTGKNKKVKEFVLGFSEAQDFVGEVTGQIIKLIPKYIREGKYHLNVCFGCTGGRHRSVVIAEEVAAHLKECGENVTVIHREI